MHERASLSYLISQPHWKDFELEMRQFQTIREKERERGLFPAQVSTLSTRKTTREREKKT